MSAHFDSEHDLIDTRPRRPVLRAAPPPAIGAQGWRDQQDDDAFAAARGIWNGLLAGAAIWALLAVCAWAVSMLWSN